MQDYINDLLYLDNLFTEEELLVKNSIRQYADYNLIPKMAECYEQAKMPDNLITELSELGVFGMTLPEQYGGSNASNVAYGLACQELERADSSVRSTVSVQSSLCMYPIYTFGSDEQKNKYLIPMSKGEIIACFGLTEADSGSDPASMQTTAIETEDGWLLNGSKMWISNATIANIAIVWANINPNNNSNSKNIRGFIVDLSLAGVTTTEIKQKLSLRASITGELSFSDVKLAKNSILPKTDKGLACALSCLSQARYGIAWGAVGAAEHCFEIVLDYTKNRKSFGKPIASNQLVQSKLADIYTEICKAKLLNLQLGRLKDNNQASHVYISMAKRNSCRVAREVASSCRDILGANGISLEYHVMRHMNNIESVYTYEGTDHIHTLSIGRYLTDINAF